MTTSGTSRANLVRHGDEFVVDGRRFRLIVEHDGDMREPWKEHDCHGVVSEWTTRKKKPGERILVQGGGSYHYYDVQASMQRACKDWFPPGVSREQVARSVEADFKRLRAWCNDEWHWAWIRVMLLDGKDAGKSESLGGLESDDEQHISEEAHNLARELLHRVVTEGKPYG